MAVAIRLSRGGAKKRPYYRIVVADSRSARDGKYLEQIGTYNPVLAKDNPDRVKFNEERARYWLGVGAQASDRVARFLDAAGIKERAARNNPSKAEPGQRPRIAPRTGLPSWSPPRKLPTLRSRKLRSLRKLLLLKKLPMRPPMPRATPPARSRPR